MSQATIQKAGYCVNRSGLRGGFIFYDYQSFHPERLGLAFLKTAVDNGCVALNHMKVTGFLSRSPSGAKKTAIHGVIARDELTGQEHSIQGKMVVNATGPWMDRILALLENRPPETLNRSTGLHVLTPDVCDGNAVFFRTRGGRHFFILPWKGFSLIGPTDTPYEGDPDDLQATQEEVESLIADANEVLPEDRSITREDVRQVIIGIRPLIAEGKKNGTYHASRRAEIYNHARDGIENLVSVAGGKWTTSRHLGESLIKTVLRAGTKTGAMQGAQQKKADTRFQPLYGSSHFGASPTRVLSEMYGRKRPPTLQECHVKHLFELYGTEIETLMQMIEKNPHYAAPLNDRKPCLDIVGQVYHAVQFESARTISDVLDRRLALGTMGYPGDEAVERTGEIMQELLSWDPAHTRKQIDSYRQNYPLVEKLPASASSSG